MEEEEKEEDEEEEEDEQTSRSYSDQTVVSCEIERKDLTRIIVDKPLRKSVYARTGI